MNTIVRRLSTVLLTLVLLVLPVAAAHGEPTSGSHERWATSISDFLGDLLDSLLSISAASEIGDDTSTQSDDGAVESTPTMNLLPTDGDHLRTTTQLGPVHDPFGAM